MKTKLLLRKLANYFPKRYAKANNDFVGIMVPKLKEETNSILLCLDFDNEVLSMIENNHLNPDLIITHHPFLFGKKSQILKHDENKKRLYDALISKNIPLYSMHTNFDTGKNGMNDALANALELHDIYSPEDQIMMRIGELKEEMNVEDFVNYALDKLNISYGLLINEGPDKIKTVAIIGGGGSRDYVSAKKHNADIYISGDAPHHVRRAMIEDRINYLDLPHEIEKIFMQQMKKILSNIDPTLKIIIIDHEKEPKAFIKK
ncbi:MAG: Nif3-like dinuclear metal center hexameric protein [Bacilli bacterium]